MASRLDPGDVRRLGVTVRIPPTLRSYTQGQDEVVLEASDLASLLRRLDEAFPGIRDRVVDETGQVRPYVNLFLNEELVSGDLDRVPLVPGDALHVLPSIAGGLDG